MKKAAIFLVFTYFICIFCNTENKFPVFKSRVNLETQKKAAQDVIIRLLGPVNAKLFVINVSENAHFENDGFHISKTENEETVRVTAPNGISAVWGVHYYLKNYCNCHISWDGDQLNLPKILPSVKISIQSIERFRYYQNVCTSSYSFVWWDWKRWEREIDWMALNGINLALAFTAQEAIWQRVYDALNLPSNDFTGPGFLAWNRMGNLRNFSHGLSTNWHEVQISLQHRILKRMRELGMTPILPAFCGVVPKSFKGTYPLSNVTKMSRWSRFSEKYCCPFLLSPKDPLFSVVAHVFLREYINEFRTDHIYNCDTFNENVPASADSEYLASISSAVYREMRQADPNAIWMIQGWMFMEPFWANKKTVQAFLGGVPIGKMLILDLQSDLTPQYERLDSYFGHPFIWCTLLNFGGQLGMYGHLSRINREVLRGRSFENSTMIGIGITPEGIDQNYLVYEFTLESSLRSELANLSQWVSNYALRRYGVHNDDTNEAWLILKDTAYNYHPSALCREGVNGAEATVLVQGEHISKNILTRLPSLKLNEFSWYNRSRMYDVYLKFLTASNDVSISLSDLFKHDFIDITRQTIQFAVSSLYFQLINGYTLNDYESFQTISSLFLGILDELEIVLKSGKKFLLGNWLESAKSCGKNNKESRHYEYDARNQITLWGPNGEIRDYAAKQWSGLIADYYKPRWSIFIEALNKSLVEHVPFNSAAVKENIFLTVEKPFGESRKIYPTEATGDPIQVIQNFNDKWGSTLYEIFKNLTSDNFEVKSV